MARYGGGMNEHLRFIRDAMPSARRDLGRPLPPCPDSSGGLLGPTFSQS
jgi:hypothetical protein